MLGEDLPSKKTITFDAEATALLVSDNGPGILPEDLFLGTLHANR